MSGLLFLSHRDKFPLKEQNLGEAGRLLWNLGEELGSWEHSAVAKKHRGASAGCRSPCWGLYTLDFASSLQASSGPYS